LTEALLFILDNPQKAIDMGQSGRDKVLREFSKEIVFSRLKKEYENLIKNYVSPKN
jgi:glycosyltransferase involved in cell wall biosynthesis